MLFVPVVLEYKVLKPTAVLAAPVVFLDNPFFPTATLAIPVVKSFKLPVPKPRFDSVLTSRPVPIYGVPKSNGLERTEVLVTSMLGTDATVANATTPLALTVNTCPAVLLCVLG